MTALLCLMLCVGLPLSAHSQGSIFGQLRNVDMAVPPDSAVLFFGFVNGTDNQIRLVSSVGAGYESGNWYDDFQNYEGASAGVPYHFYFFDVVAAESALLTGPVPDNSFQQEDVGLTAGAWPAAATAFSGELLPDGTTRLRWSRVADVTWHVYRRETASNGAFRRIDNVSGDLSDRGVADSTYADLTSDATAYSYVLIGEANSAVYSPPSAIITASAGSCCTDTTGNVDMSADGIVDIADLQQIIDYLFITFRVPECLDAANTDGSADGMVDIADLQRVIDYLFITFEPLAPCR
ncbi:MAG: hypothetical protein KKA42_16760 [candidate division Zixibacteria bacterium]|nr:hypothetical protein [candidate division Zixibacteria bacterium]